MTFVRHSNTLKAQKLRAMKEHWAEMDKPVGTVVGRLAHVLIGELLADGVREADPKRIARQVRTLPFDATAQVHPYAVAQQLVVAAAIYLRLFLPAPEWQLSTREMASHQCRFDLVFESSEGVLVDEIKTGRLDGRLEAQNFENQIVREVAAGDAEWGTRFRGVRAIVLSAPRKSAIHHVDGSSTPLPWGLSDD